MKIMKASKTFVPSDYEPLPEKPSKTVTIKDSKLAKSMSVSSLKRTAMGQNGDWRQKKEKTYCDQGYKKYSSGSGEKNSYVFDEKALDVPEFVIKLSELKKNEDNRSEYYPKKSDISRKKY